MEISFGEARLLLSDTLTEEFSRAVVQDRIRQRGLTARESCVILDSLFPLEAVPAESPDGACPAGVPA